MKEATDPPTESMRTAEPRLRRWPILLLSVTGMSCMLVPTLLGMDDSVRFSVLAGGAFVHLLLLGLWVLFGSRVPWRDRGLFGILGIVGLALVFVAQHRSLGISILLYGTPIAATSLAIALLATPHLSWNRRRWLAFFAWLIPLLLWLPSRSEGFVASFAPELRWRWSPDVEQRSKMARSHPTTEAVAVRAVTKVELQDGDWPRFRGLNSDGIADDREIAIDATAAPKLVWKRAIGPAWSSVIVVDGLLYTQEQRGPQEAVVCLDASNGRDMWAYTYDARFEDKTQVSGTGPRSTPTFANGRIYSVGGTGIVTCLSAIDGQRLWQRELSKDCNTPEIMWGFSMSPSLQRDRCFLVGGGNRPDSKDAICYDANDGQIRWSTLGTGETYSSPQLVDLCYEPQVVVSVGKGIVGRSINDGAERWRIQREGIGNSVLQPIPFAENQLLIASGEGNGTSLYEIQRTGDEWKAVEKWSSSRLRPDFSDVVILPEMVVGLTKGLLTCIDSEDGHLLWKKFRFGSGQLIALPAHRCVLVLSEQGELNLIRVTRQEPTLLANWPGISGKTWNHPVLVKNRIYLRNAEEIACYSLD